MEENFKEDERRERLMNYVVINLEDNSSHFFDTEQIAFDYIFFQDWLYDCQNAYR